MADEQPLPANQPGTSPGTITRLVHEVFRENTPGRRGGWDDGLAPGAVVGRYELIREIGRGGFGIVWEARDRELGRRVAFKAVLPRGDAYPEARIIAEAEVAARLSHPNVVTVLDAGRSEHGVYLVLEYLVGRTLSARLASARPSLREALAIGAAVARGVAHAHAHGVVHRDLTPRNVFLCDDGQVKLLDLGLSQAFGRRRVRGGTPDFMAPEQASGEPEDERVDVFALGVLLLLMLVDETATRPSEPAGSSRRRLARGRVEVPELPDLGPLVDSMLEREPARRPSDVAEVATSLERMAASLESGRGHVPSAARVRRRWRSPRLLVGGAVLLVGVAAFLAGTAWRAEAPGSFTIAGSSDLTGCNWKLRRTHHLDELPPGAVTRQGAMGGQAAAAVQGRSAWLQESDWNNLYIPLGLEAADVFAVQAEFFMPPAATWPRLATLVVLTDPSAEGNPSASVHGVGVELSQPPNASPRMTWRLHRGADMEAETYTGSLTGPLVGRWRLVRIEGSRSGCWFRVLLDGAPLVVARSACDLAGGHALLGGNDGPYFPAQVAWSNLATFEGGPRCR
jgi:tRNA A-37 threonylcarbamoyl transferase component Bud32